MAEDPTSPKSDSSEDTRRYWEHLDAKFATLNTPPTPAPEPVHEPAAPWTPDPEPETTSASDPVPVPVTERQPVSGLIVEAFAALLALEDGEPGARAVRLTFEEKHPPAAAAMEATISDAMIEDVVRRVIERMAPDVVRAVVADIVSETAERLVKEEIDRIRNQHV
jgi:hypothetical protein